MTLACRAIWQDNRNSLVDLGAEVFAAWASNKHDLTLSIGAEFGRSADGCHQPGSATSHGTSS